MAEIARTFTKAALQRITSGSEGAKLIGANIATYTGTTVQALLQELATNLNAKVGTADSRLSDARTPTDASVTAAKAASGHIIPIICTSGTRPATAAVGQLIRETDTGLAFYNSGTVGTPVWSRSEPNATTTLLGLGQLATNAEAETGTDTTKITSPSRVHRIAKGIGTFRAYKSAATQSITVATNTKITFDAEDWDFSGWYDPATSRFTPQRAGWYMIGMGIRYASGEDTNRYDTWIAKNGTLTTIAATLDNRGASGTGQISQVGWAPVLFNGTSDFIEGAVFVSAGTTRTISTGAHLTWLAGFPIYFT